MSCGVPSTEPVAVLPAGRPIMGQAEVHDIGLDRSLSRVTASVSASAARSASLK
jgi:hypothetical protein